MRIKTIAHLMALIICMGAFCITAYASDGGKGNESNETIMVNAAWASRGAKDTPLLARASWIDGELLRIDVTDEQAEENSSLALRLSDYIKETDNSEYISIQAVDLDGNKSGIIEIKNPYYKPQAETAAVTEISDETEAENNTTEKPEETMESAVSETPSEVAKPFTPDGNGAVIDNATESDGKEFFTITTEDNNVFYLIVDRQRNGENVYLLNAVTEEDLAALSQKSNTGVSGENVGGSMSVIPVPEPETETAPEPETVQKPEIQPPAQKSNTGTIVLVIIAVLAAGGAGYYFKIYKPKKDTPDMDDDMEFEDDNAKDETDDTGEDEYGDYEPIEMRDDE